VLFRQLHVSRFWDASHQSFVYVVWTARVINGSPKNSISAVVAQPWGSQAPDLSLMNSDSGSPANNPCSFRERQSSEKRSAPSVHCHISV
jgi:CreA protein